MGRWTVVTLFSLTLAAAAFGAAPALREQVSLNGSWPTGGSVPRYDSQNVAFDTKTYERQVTVPSTWGGKRIQLEFNAVNWYCDVYVNDVKIGSHTGAWVPFEFDITGRVSAGQTFALRLEVKGMLQTPTQQNGKIVWWIGYNDLDKARAGIVDDVWLRAYAPVHIEDAFVQTSVRNGTVKVDYTLRNTTGSSWTGRVNANIVRESTNQTEKTLQTADVTLAAGQTKTVSVSASWTNAALWWPDQPNLYHLKSSLSSGGDSETRRFGFKEFWIEGNQFRLNGIRMNIRGDWSCFSQYWGSITGPSVLKTKYEAMRKTNANMLRWHKHPAPRFAYEMADEMGIMVMNESALYGRPHYKHDQQTQLIDNCITLIPSWIKAARNHASVMMWSACNEATYGGLSAIPASQLKRLGDAIYALDSTRPVNYDGDHSVPGVMINRHYPEGYEKNPPNNDSYNAWKNLYDGSRPTYFGEILAVRPGTNDNGWWIGVWPRGLRHIGFAGIAPRVFYDGGRISSAQVELQAAAYNPIALFDIAYDKLGIAPYRDNALPSLDEGAWVTRRVVLYNDDYRNTSVTAEVELNIDGTSYGKGSKTFSLALGSKLEFDVTFQAPKQGGKVLRVIYRTYKNGTERFEETKRFNLRETGQSGSTSNVVTLDGGAPVNQAPSVSLTGPANGATFTAPASITLSASASDSDGTVTKVEFFSGSTKLGEDTTAPYSIAWTNVAAGIYSLTARATDNDGATKTSAAVAVTVQAPVNQAPTVSITSPANGATLTAPADLTVTANAADSDGSVAHVELFLNNTLVRRELTAPYSWGGTDQNDPSIKGLPSGTYTLRAVATDNAGATAQASVTVTVNNPAPALRVDSLTLVNADTDADIGALNNGATLNLALLPTRRLAIRANTTPATVGSVRITLDGGSSTTQNGAPYSFPTDNGGNYAAWTPAAGAHTFVATPFSAGSGGGSAGTALTVNFTVTDALPFAVEITRVASGATVSTATAKTGALQYTDRTYTITALSAGLNNGVLLRQANDDKLRTGSAELTFSVNAPATVYICYDKRYTALPAFLNDGSWTRSSESLSTTDAPASAMVVFSKSVPAGSVTLGGNRQPPAAGAWTHYIPIVKPASASREALEMEFAPMGPQAQEAWAHAGDSDGDGLFDDYEIANGLNPALADSDGNGLQDEDEFASGTTLRHFEIQNGFGFGNGNGGGGGMPGTVKALSVMKLAGAAKFASSGKDSVSLSGTLELPAGLQPGGVEFLVDVGGAAAAFTLDGKAKAKSAAGAVSLKFKKLRDRATRTTSLVGGTVPFTVKLRGSFAEAWSALGLDGAVAVKGAALHVPVLVRFDGAVFAAGVATKVTVKAGVSGVFKK